MHATAIALAVSSIAAFPALPVCELCERSNPKGRMYLVGRVGTLKPLVIETVDRSKVAKVWQACFGQGHTPRRGLRRWRVRLSSSRIDDALSVRVSTEMEQLAPQ